MAWPKRFGAYHVAVQVPQMRIRYSHSELSAEVLSFSDQCLRVVVCSTEDATALTHFNSEDLFAATCHSCILLEDYSRGDLGKVRDLNEIIFPSCCFIFEAKVPGLGAYFEMFMTSGLTHSKNSLVCRNCSSPSPRNPTTTSVAMEMGGNPERKRLIMVVKSETVYLLFIDPRITSEPDRTDRSKNL